MLKVLFLSKIYPACHLGANGIKPGSSENKGGDQLRDYRTADLILRLLFRIYGNSRFSHDLAHLQSQDVPGLLYILSGIVCVLSSVLCAFLRETKDRDLDDMIHENTTQKSEKENGNIKIKVRI